MRISATLLDSFRMYRDEDWMTLERIVADIKGEGEVTEPMLRGRAFHTVLENNDATGQADGYTFENIGLALAVVPQNGIDELKITAPFLGHTVVGKVDSIEGLEVHEYKTTERFSVEKYMDAIQWRIYLDLFGAKRCTYHVFPIKADGPKVRILDHHPIPVYAYPTMHRDIEQLVADFAAFVKRQGLQDCLPEAA